MKCVECGENVPNVYKKYSKGAIRLTQCVSYVKLLKWIQKYMYSYISFKFFYF